MSAFIVGFIFGGLVSIPLVASCIRHAARCRDHAACIRFKSEYLGIFPGVRR